MILWQKTQLFCGNSQVKIVTAIEFAKVPFLRGFSNIENPVTIFNLRVTVSCVGCQFGSRL